MSVMEQKEALNAFAIALDTLIDKALVGHPLVKFKSMARERFVDMGLPTKKDERFKYIKLRSLYEQTYEHIPQTHADIDITPYVLPEAANSALVFVNGVFRPHLSRLDNMPSKMVVLPLSQAMVSYGALLQNQLSRACRDEADPFALLNLCLHHEGVFLYLPPRTLCDAPIQLLHIIDGTCQASISCPRLQLFVGAGAQASIVSTHVCLSPLSHCINQVVDAHIEDNARLRYTQDNCHTNPLLWHFDALRAHLKKDAHLEALSATAGCDTVRHDYRVALAGSNAEALLHGVWMLRDKREAHHHVLIEHQAPHCTSRQLFKGVLDDNARSSFEGKIAVSQAAQKTNAFQLNNNLLLSDYAEARSKPNLEIFADDVKASHGSTVGQLDSEEQFYMLSRGFSPSAAKNFLVYAFCQEVIDKINVPTLKASISALTRAYLQV
jgi:Fe-S cluster assembly protein SufD